MPGGARSLVAVGLACPAFRRRVAAPPFVARLCGRLGLLHRDGKVGAWGPEKLNSNILLVLSTVQSFAFDIYIHLLSMYRNFGFLRKRVSLFELNFDFLFSKRSSPCTGKKAFVDLCNRFQWRLWSLASARILPRKSR